MFSRAAVTLLMLVMAFAAQKARAAQPVGWFDECTGGAGFIHLSGWAYDPDDEMTSLYVHVYLYTNAACTSQYGDVHVLTANFPRQDVNDARHIEGDHGFRADFSIAAGNYWVKVIAIDLNGNGNPQLEGSPKAVTVTPWAQWEGYGASHDPFLIKTIADLDHLAANVNSGTNYNGTFFRLEADLNYGGGSATDNNYTPIGNINHLFGGEFDGGGHTVSGIRIRKTGSDNTEEVHGFFGQIDTGANIHDLHLTDTRITGYDYVGGIVGYIKSGTVSNCTVSESAITATNDEDDVCCGTICGINYGTLSHNYYHHCTVNGTAVISGAGSEKEDVTDNDGAVPFPALIDTEDNTAIITKYNGQTIPVVLEGRTLYKDGAWNTLCLPFDLTIADSPLDGDGVDVRTLSSSDFQDGTLTLTFTNAGAVTKLQAGRPYIIKWNNTGHHLTDNDLVFLDAEVSATTPATETAGSEWVDFCGTYAPQPLYESGTEKHNLYLGADNTLYYPTVEGFKVNAFRGWFQLKKGLTAGTPSAHVRAFSLNFGDGSEETGIWEMKNEQLKMNNEAGAWYTLDGVKLNAQPTHKGLYIHGGRKVAIK